MDDASTDPVSRRRTLLKVIGGTVLGSGMAAGSASTLTGTGTTDVNRALRIESVEVPTAPDAAVTQSDERAFQVAANLRQGDTLRIEVTILNQAGGPAVSQANIQSPAGILPHLSVDDSEFDSSNRVLLIIQLQGKNTLTPGYYTTEVDISPLSIESESEDGNRADVHFLLDNSLSARNDLDTINRGVTGFFDAVEKQSGGNRIDLAASVSAFGGEESETDDGTAETRVVQQVTTASDDVEAAAEEVKNDSESKNNEDGYVALRNVLNGDAGRRSGADQIPILFSDELGPNVLSDQNEIEDLQDRVTREAAGFIGIGDTKISSRFPPDIKLPTFTNNVTNDIDGEFFESPNLTTEKLAGEIADTVRAAVDPDATGTLVDEETFVFEF